MYYLVLQELEYVLHHPGEALVNVAYNRYMCARRLQEFNVYIATEAIVNCRS